MLDRLFRPVDIRSLAAFRILFGTIMLLAMMRYFAYGWIDVMYTWPQIFFPYEGFEWVRPWPGVGMQLHYGVLAVLAFCIAAGVAYRASIALFFVGFTYAHLIDKTNYLNHYYLVSLIAFLMIFMPLGREWSVDAYRFHSSRVLTAPRWMVSLLRFQLAVVYVFAGIAKLNADWLLQAQPLKFWLSAHSDMAILGPLLTSALTPYLFSWAGALFDLTIVFFLLWRRTRFAAYLTVVGFHLVTGFLFPIGLFPWIMIALTTIFFEPDWPRPISARFGNDPRIPLGPPLEKGEDRLLGMGSTSAWMFPRAINPSWTRCVVVASLCTWILIQLAVPLRFLVRTGDVNWTEDGFRFAWRVMLIEKRGDAAFEIRDMATGRRTRIDPRQYLTPMQVHMMSTQPDMILQFAHWLVERERGAGHEVEVRAQVEASLNGRPHQPLVDPDIDLARIASGTPAAAWTVPLGSDATRSSDGRIAAAP